MKGGSFPPPSPGLSALHGEACQALFLEAIAHGHRIIAVAKSDKTGTVESLAVLFEALDIGAEVTKTADLAKVASETSRLWRITVIRGGQQLNVTLGG